MKPDGQNPEPIAWGIRNPFGIAFDEAGELYVTDNDYEEKGERTIGQDPDRTDNFGPGHRGKIFLCQFGSYAPLWRRSCGWPLR